MNLSDRFVDDIKKASKVTSYCEGYPAANSDVVTFFTVELPNKINEVFTVFSFFEGNENVKNISNLDLSSKYFCLNRMRAELDFEINKFLNGEKTFLKSLSGEQTKNLVQELFDDLHNSIEENYSRFELRYLRKRQAG
jgi:hypothetical protein